MKRAATPIRTGALATLLVALLAAGALWVAGGPALPRLWASVANALSGNAFAAPGASAPDAPTSTNPAPAATSANAAAVAANASGAAASNSRGSALTALDTEIVSQRVTAGNRPANAFAPKSWQVAAPPPAPPPPPPVVLPPPPPPPQAPPLPFKYVGVLHVSADLTYWYLLKGERLIVAATGEVIDDTHRIDGADAGQLRFTYLPLAQRQALAIGGTP